MKTTFLSVFVFLVLSKGALAALSKEQVDGEVAYFRSFIVGQMWQQDCSSQVSLSLDQSDDAHKLFMADKPIAALYKELYWIEETSRFALQHPNCPFHIIPRAQNGTLYATYAMEQGRLRTQPQLSTPETLSEPTEEQRKLLSDIYELSARRMIAACNKKPCSKEELKVIDYSKYIYDELNKTPVRYNYILAFSFGLRRYIAEGYVTYNHEEPLKYINDKTLMTIRMLTPYVYAEPLTLLRRFQLQLIQYAVQERKPESQCTVFIHDLLQSSYSELTGDKKRDVLRLIFVYHRWFELLNERITHYYGYSFANCTMKNEVAQVPHLFAKAVLHYLSETMNW